MKILLTGCYGQLGQALQVVLVHHDLRCTDYDVLDISNEAQVTSFVQSFKPELIINSAAYTRVDEAEAESNRDMVWLVNAEGPGFLAKAGASIGASIVQISTDYVFGGESQSFWKELDPTEPLSIYGQSKLAGERLVAENNPEHYIVRTAWLYHYSGENFLRTIFRLSDRGEIRVVDDQVGSPTNADDLADALVGLIVTKSYGIHHLVNSGSTSWYGLTREFFRRLDISTAVIPVTTSEFPRPAPRPASSVLLSDRKPRIQLPSWENGVNRLVEEIKIKGWG